MNKQNKRKEVIVKIAKIALPILLAILLLSPLMLPPYALADDTLVDIDIASPWSIVAWVSLTSPNVTIYLDGVPLQSIISSGISAAVAASAPNSQYSGVSSPGWEGYFGITSNIEEYTLEHKKFSENPGELIAIDRITLNVYKGAGCGGIWGVADGYPDLWARRQLIGFLFLTKVLQWNIEDLVTQQSIQQTSMTTLGESNNRAKITIERQDVEIQSLRADMAMLKASHEGRLAELEAQNKTTLVASIVVGIIAAISIIIAVVAFFRRRRWE